MRDPISEDRRHRGRPSRRWVLPAALLAAIVLAAACGNRLDHDEIVAAAGGGQTTGPGAAVEPGATADVPGVAASDAGIGAGGDAGGGDTAGPVSGGDAGGGDNAGAGTATAGGGGSAEAGATRSTRPAAKAPIVLGNVGSYSGLGSTTAGARTILQVWAQWVTERGGLDGHPVRVVTADDGGDPARHQALVQDMVENQNVFAFIGNWAPFNQARSAQAYLEQRRVPVIGGDATDAIWWSSPMFFPQASHPSSITWGLANIAGRKLGKKRLAIIYCAESVTCKQVRDDLVEKGYAKQNGLEVVYEAQVSIAQPDFTAQCVQAQRAQADVFSIADDASSARRLAASCARQGYRPTYIAGSLTLANNMAEEPTLDGLQGLVQTFPWFVNTAETKEFFEAGKRYAPDLELTSSTALGWVSGKLVERAIAAAGGLGNPPDREKLLAGLWSLQNESLGGLTAPITFAREKPAPPTKCFFHVRIAKGEWDAPDGPKVSGCQP